MEHSTAGPSGIWHDKRWRWFTIALLESDFPVTIRGRVFTLDDLEFLRALIKSNPQALRSELARRACEELNWFQANGKPKEMGCRMAMLALHRAGLITLPPSRRSVHRHAAQSQQPRQHTSAGQPQDPIVQPVSELAPIQLEPVTSTSSALWTELVDRYHYLGYTILRGAQLRYLIRSTQGYVAAIGFSSPAWKTRDRDAWIGWDHATRAKNLHYIVNNARFLILPWVTSKNLASKILGLCARQLPQDWETRYGYRPVLFETFVEQERFAGTCYRAANWVRVGQTTGRGKWEQKGANKVRAPLSIKDIFVYPLQRDYKALLLG